MTSSFVHFLTPSLIHHPAPLCAHQQLLHTDYRLFKLFRFPLITTEGGAGEAAGIWLFGINIARSLRCHDVFAYAKNFIRRTEISKIGKNFPLAESVGILIFREIASLMDASVFS